MFLLILCQALEKNSSLHELIEKYVYVIINLIRIIFLT